MEINLSLLQPIRRKAFAHVFSNVQFYTCCIKMNKFSGLVFTGRRTYNSWFAYSIPKKPKDVGTPLFPLSDEELDDYDRLPRDYDKEVHDNLFRSYICECMLFIIAIIQARAR